MSQQQQKHRVGPKLSFHTAASQAKAEQQAAPTAAASASGPPKFTLARNAVQQQQQHEQQVVLRPQLSGGRALTLRGESAQATPAGFVIQTSADDGRRVQRSQPQQKKRHSGQMDPASGTESEMPNPAASFRIGAGAGAAASKKTLGRVTVINEAAMRDEPATAAGFDDEQDPRVSFSKRSRVTVTNNRGGGSAALSAASNVGFATMWDSDANTQAFMSSFSPPPFATSSLPVAAPLPGVVKFNGNLVDSIAKARSERLATQAQATNNSTTKGSAFTGAASPVPASSASPPPAFNAGNRRPAAAGTTIVLLRNLNPGITPKFILTQLFGLFDVHKFHVDTDPATGLCSGTAEAHFLNATEAEEAIRIGQGQVLYGQPVRLSIVQASEETPFASAQIAPAPQQQQQQQQPRQQQQQQQVQSQQPRMSSVATLSSATTSNSSSNFVQDIRMSPLPSRAPVATSSSVIERGNPSSVFRSGLLNAGFVVERDADPPLLAAEAAQDTVFNITNLRGAQGARKGNTASNAAAAATGPLTLVGGGKKTLQLRPKTAANAAESSPTAESSAAATQAVQSTTSTGRQLKLAPKAAVSAVHIPSAAAAAAAPASNASAAEPSAANKPSFKLNRQPLSSVVVPPSSTQADARQPKSVVLAPAKR